MTKKIDQRQMQIDFSAVVDRFVDACTDIEAAISRPKAPPQIEDEFELCVEIAAAVKRAIRESGLSQALVADGVNAYFGRTKFGAKADPPICRNPLSEHMLNNYLSKPADNPIPAYYLVAICHVTECFHPIDLMLSIHGARVATKEEVRQMNLGRLEENIKQMQATKRELLKNA